MGVEIVSNAMPTADDLLRAALDYAARGLRVVPLHRVVGGVGADAVCSCGREGCINSAGKHPRPAAWQREATTNQRLLSVWWGANGDPLGNIGIALGTGSGVVGVDIDPPNGESVLKMLAGEDLPPTWEMTTGKGRRLIYAIPDSLPFEPKTHALKDADGHETIRVQGTGGQCVMPPSWHPHGRRYEWVASRSPGDIEPASMPAWLIRLMEPAPVKAVQARATVDAAGAGAFPPWTDFNRRGDWWRDILGPAGARSAGKRADGVEYVTRPDKTGGVSATIGYYKATDGTDALYVFTGNWPELDAGKCYDKFGTLARLAFGGDYAATAKALAADGYGELRNGKSRPTPPQVTPAATLRNTNTNSGDEWDEPVPLTPVDEQPQKFPLDVFPAWLGCFCESVASHTDSPPDYAAVYCLGAVAGAIGATMAVRLTPEWTERAALYAAVVAEKSRGKSPAFAAVTHPFVREQARRTQAGEKDLAYVSDPTTAAIAQRLSKAPRGLAILRDEIDGWIKSFNQFRQGGQGDDRQIWLEVWSGAPINVARKSLEESHLFVAHPCVTVVGAIQPAVMMDILGRDDGLTERILFAYPDPLPAQRAKRGTKYAEADSWERAILGLLTRSMVRGEYGPRPWYLELGEGAWEVFEDWTGDLAVMLNDPDRNKCLDGTLSKLKGYAARLTLVLHLMRHCGEEIPPPVPAEAMAGGVRLCRYFLDHAQRLRNISGRNIGPANLILDWLRKKPCPEVSRRDILRGLHRQFPKADDLREPLRVLVQHGWLRYADDSAPGQARYRVHPALSPAVAKSGDTANYATAKT